ERIGGISTYKATGTWQLAPEFSISGGYQRAVRAPNFQELFSPTTLGFGTLPGGIDPCSFDSPQRTGPDAAAVRALCLAQGVPASIIDTYKYPVAAYATFSQGNEALKEESADTYSVGIVWRSPARTAWLANLQGSIDYYDIRITGAIAPVSGSISISRCFNQDGSNPSYSPEDLFCGNLIRD